MPAAISSYYHCTALHHQGNRNVSSILDDSARLAARNPILHHQLIISARRHGWRVEFTRNGLIHRMQNSEQNRLFDTFGPVVSQW